MDNRGHAVRDGDDVRRHNLPVVGGGLRMSSPQLDQQPRSRERAALDQAMQTLARIEAHCREYETVKFVREQIARISDILNS